MMNITTVVLASFQLIPCADVHLPPAQLFSPQSSLQLMPYVIMDLISDNIQKRHCGDSLHV